MYDYKALPQIVPMLASVINIEDESLFVDDNVIAERKYNGSRCISIRNNYEVTLMSRTWKSDYTSDFDGIYRELLGFQTQQFVLDGEIVFYHSDKDSGGYRPEEVLIRDEHFLTARAKAKKKELDLLAIYHIFDVLHVGTVEVKKLPWLYRQKWLSALFPHEPLVSVRKAVSYWGEVDKREAWNMTLRFGGEGLMFKRIDSVYQEGSRNHDWRKYKPFKTADCVVLGYTKGKGAREDTFGAMLLGQYDTTGRLWYVGKTSGFSDEDLYNWLELLNQIPTNVKDLNLVNVDTGGSVASSWFWVKPHYVVEVHFLNRTDDKKFYLPRFEEERTDKNPQDCVMYES